MNISITGLGLTSENLNHFTKNKLKKLIERYSSINKTQISINKDQEGFLIQAIISDETGTRPYKTVHKDAYEGVNELTKKIHSYMVKKKKVQKNKRRNALLPPDVSCSEYEELKSSTF